MLVWLTSPDPALYCQHFYTSFYSSEWCCERAASQKSGLWNGDHPLKRLLIATHLRCIGTGDYVLNLPPSPPVNFKEKYPNAPDLAVDLLCVKAWTKHRFRRGISFLFGCVCDDAIGVNAPPMNYVKSPCARVYSRVVLSVLGYRACVFDVMFFVCVFRYRMLKLNPAERITAEEALARTLHMKMLQYLRCITCIAYENGAVLSSFACVAQCEYLLRCCLCDGPYE